MPEHNLRREIRFRGRVQGVGFRATVREVARRFAVVGFVQNLDDGRVLLTAEASPEELDRFAAAVEAAMQRYIVGRDVSEGPATGAWRDFQIVV